MYNRRHTSRARRPTRAAPSTWDARDASAVHRCARGRRTRHLRPHTATTHPPPLPRHASRATADEASTSAAPPLPTSSSPALHLVARVVIVLDTCGQHRGQGVVSPDANTDPRRSASGWPLRMVFDGDAFRGVRGAADEAGGGRARVRRRPPNPPSGPAHEEHGHRARRPRVRRENELPRGAHRHQRGEGGENAGGERAAGVRPPLRRPPRGHQRRGCRKI